MIGAGGQRGGYRKRTGARRAGTAWALRAADVDPRQIAGIGGARGIQAKPVPGRRGGNATPSRRYGTAAATLEGFPVNVTGPSSSSSPFVNVTEYSGPSDTE